MLKIFKYPVPITDYFELDLPIGAQILDVAMQGAETVMWALVDPGESVVDTRRFRLAGTGHIVQEGYGDLRHIATFQMHSGTLVWHVFEIMG